MMPETVDERSVAEASLLNSHCSFEEREESILADGGGGREESLDYFISIMKTINL